LELPLKNKYFSCTVPIEIYPPNSFPSEPVHFGVIIISNFEVLPFLSSHSSLLQTSECNILFSQSDCEQLNVEEDYALETVCGSLEESKEQVNGETIGVARIKEAMECAVAAFWPKNQESQKVKKVSEDPLKHDRNLVAEATPEEIEKDLLDFEYFLNKIKENSENSKFIDDENRKNKAEETIRELVEYLKLNEDDD